jgi:hypothetical protein
MLWIGGVIVFGIVVALATTKPPERDPVLELLQRLQREGQVIKTVVDGHPVAVRIEAVSGGSGKRELIVVDGRGDHATVRDVTWCVGSEADFQDPLFHLVAAESAPEGRPDDMAPG